MNTCKNISHLGIRTQDLPLHKQALNQLRYEDFDEY